MFTGLLQNFKKRNISMEKNLTVSELIYHLIKNYRYVVFLFTLSTPRYLTKRNKNI